MSEFSRMNIDKHIESAISKKGGFNLQPLIFKGELFVSGKVLPCKNLVNWKSLVKQGSFREKYYK